MNKQYAVFTLTGSDIKLFSDNFFESHNEAKEFIETVSGYFIILEIYQGKYRIPDYVEDSSVL